MAKLPQDGEKSWAKIIIGIDEHGLAQTIHIDAEGRQFTKNLVVDPDTLEWVNQQQGGAGTGSDVNVTNDSIAVTGPLTDTQLRAADVKITLDGEKPTVAIDQTTPGTTNAVSLVDTAGQELDFRKEAENANAADHGILVFARDYESTPQKYRQIRCTADGYLEVQIEGHDDNYLEPSNADFDTGAGDVTRTMFGIALPGSGGPVIGGTATNPVVNKEGRPSSASVAQVGSSASNVTLKAANAARLGLTIFNDSTQVLYVKYGATASALDYTVKIAAGGYFEAPFPCYTGKVDGIWASANGNAYITETSA